MGNLEESQKNLYLGKFEIHGDSPKALSWNDKKSQHLRFQRLSELFRYEKDSETSSVHEIGCGLAHFKDFLDKSKHSCIYSGSDIIPEFIEHCESKHPQCQFSIQNIATDYDQILDTVKGKDYYCLNGTFYTKEDNSVADWESFIFRSIANMFKMARKGIAFNFLTVYSQFYDEKLYYADPKEIMDWCIKNLSRFVLIEHDIPLYEFFVCVYREEYVKERFPDYERYL